MNPKNTHITDEVLMVRWQNQSDLFAFEALYNRHFTSVKKYLFYLSKSIEKSKDMTQDIFIKVYEKPHLFDRTKLFKPWIFTIAKNHWKNEIRQSSTQRKHYEYLIKIQNNIRTESENQTRRLQELNKALFSLSEVHKEVFILKYINNFSIKEISQICDCREGTVKSRLFYALQKIRNNVQTKKYISI